MRSSDVLVIFVSKTNCVCMENLCMRMGRNLKSTQYNLYKYVILALHMNKIKTNYLD